MSVIKIDPEKCVSAAYYRGWTMSIFGQPKITFRCGHCSQVFVTREYLPFTDGRKSAAICPFCSWWNTIPLVYG